MSTIERWQRALADRIDRRALVGGAVAGAIMGVAKRRAKAIGCSSCHEKWRNHADFGV